VYRVYSDGTQLVFNGDLSYHPVFLTLLNIVSSTRRHPWCHKLVGLIPSIAAAKADRKKPFFHKAKITMFQSCLDTVLESTLVPSTAYKLFFPCPFPYLPSQRTIMYSLGDAESRTPRENSGRCSRSLDIRHAIGQNEAPSTQFTVYRPFLF